MLKGITSSSVMPTGVKVVKFKNYHISIHRRMSSRG